ncbi:MAG: ABC transporter substrate-binding protein, partial [Alkalispirochaeta sp.]
MNIRFLRTATIIALVAIGVSTTILYGWSRRPIVIGFQGPLTGTAADLGVQGRNGAQLAVETLNAEGGVRRRALRLDARDDRNRREVAQELVRAFEESDVDVVIGPMTSVAGLAVVEHVATAGPLYVSPTVSTPGVSDRDDFFFRLQAATDRPATVLGSFATRELGVQRVAVIADTGNAEYSAAFTESFSQSFEAHGGELVAAFEVPMSLDSRWSAMIESIAAENPEALLVVASAGDTARFVQAVRSVEPEWLLLGSGWAATEVLPKIGGAAVDGMVLARMSFRALSSTPRGADFQNRFLRRFGRPPSFAASQAYDAVMVVARTMDRVGTDTARLREELSSLNRLETLLGPVTPTPTGA